MSSSTAPTPIVPEIQKYILLPPSAAAAAAKMKSSKGKKRRKQQGELVTAPAPHQKLTDPIYNREQEKRRREFAGLSTSHPAVGRTAAAAPRGYELLDIPGSEEELEERMKEVLERKNMVDLDKWRLYSQLALRRYIETHRAQLQDQQQQLTRPRVRRVPAPPRRAAAAAAAARPAPEDLLSANIIADLESRRKDSNDVVEEAYGILGEKRRTLINALVTFLTQVPRDILTWDEHGRIVVDGSETVQNSNISELVADVVNSKDTGHLVRGSDKFRVALHRASVPYNLVKNKKKYYTQQEFQQRMRELPAEAAARTRSGAAYASQLLSGRGGIGRKGSKCVTFKIPVRSRSTGKVVFKKWIRCL